MTRPRDTALRAETPRDVAAIGRLIDAAFATAAHRSGREAAIVADLRAAGALAVSFVAVDGSAAIVGHVAFSPVAIDGETGGWYGLGPVSVRPDRQGEGVGGRLIRAGLARLAGARGCVVLGEPGYYRRFGFVADPDLRLDGVPAEYFMRLALRGPVRKGRVAYHPAFDAR